MITSPLIPNANTKLVREIESSKVVEGYQNELNLDVTEYFAGPTFQVRECEASGYQFYYPYSLVGNESLYRHLQHFDWNYKAHKWEYNRIAEFLRGDSTVLDVGCGQGAFLTIAEGKGLEAHGLELNSSAAELARSNGLRVSTESISDHARANPERYDAVCSFQVLEHIPHVNTFIADCIAALKPGGLLVFGVPNNDGFLKYADAFLNMPPHHMGLWTERSLSALADVFDLKLIMIEREPLQEIDWYMSVMERRFLRGRLVRKIYYSLGGARVMRAIVSYRSNNIAGHTIVAAYRKDTHERHPSA